MPTYIIRRSPEHAEYLLWSTVVDAPVSEVLSRDEVITKLAYGLPVDADLAHEQASRRVQRADERGTSELETPYFGWDMERFWWRENAPEEYGEPYEVEDEPGLFIGRTLTRDELFEACR